MDDYKREISREAKKRSDLLRLGSHDPKCCKCGLQKLVCLRIETLPQGRPPADKRIICFNCQAEDIDPGSKASRERRRRKELVRLGLGNLICGICGCANILRLGVDHLQGRKFGDDVWLVCANCHEERTDLQVREHPPVGEITESQLQKARKVILNEADILEFKSRWLRKFAEDGNWEG
jgi:hypothetical protein